MRITVQISKNNNNNLRFSRKNKWKTIEFLPMKLCELEHKSNDFKPSSEFSFSFFIEKLCSLSKFTLLYESESPWKMR